MFKHLGELIIIPFPICLWMPKSQTLPLNERHETRSENKQTHWRAWPPTCARQAFPPVALLFLAFPLFSVEALSVCTLSQIMS